MSEKTIYNDLIKAGMTHAGACALMGNMKAESSMKSNIAQRLMTNLSDEDYTANFDANPDKYIHDGVGYGLCQWTYWSRKKNLKQFAQNWGVSVGAEDMQTAFAVYELKTDFADLWKKLCTENNIDSLCDKVCNTYEKPSFNNYVPRRNYAHEFDTKFKVEAPKPQYVPFASLEDIAVQLEELAKIIRELK